jgi:hypothetical protein
VDKPSRKKITALVSVMLLLVLFLTLFISGCVQETFSEVEKPPPVEEISEEDLEKEREAQRQQEEEERILAEERKREERRLREEERKEELGVFYVPLPPEDMADNNAVKAKGIYVTSHTVGRPDRFNALMDLIRDTELNSMVIDVKNDHGVMSYRSDIQIVQELNANTSLPIKDIDAVMLQLKERDIYPIARIVVFRDPHLPERRPEWAIQKKTGGPWRDNKKFAWVNPYEKNVWDYNIAIAKEAALKGFREIQFDYVRFPENAARVDREANYPGSEGIEKDEAIRDFLIYAREQLADYNVFISADVFGVIATSWGDSDKIGQTWEMVSPIVDFICPMIYPSHYGPGYFGFPVPDANPSGTVRRALSDATKRNAPLENPAIIRPWLQSFTATWVKGYIPYGAREVRLQIDAALALGIDEFLIWNAGNRYISDSFYSMQKAEGLELAALQNREEKGKDLLGRTADNALTEFLEAIRTKNWREAHVNHGTDFSMDHHAYKAWVDSWTGRLTAYRIGTPEGDLYAVNYTITSAGEKYERQDERFQLYRENGIWKVKPSVEFVELLTMEPELRN